jgi:hypothetical protein
MEIAKWEMYRAPSLRFGAGERNTLSVVAGAGDEYCKHRYNVRRLIVPRDETVEPGSKIIALSTVFGEGYSVVEEARPVFEPRRYRFGDKGTQELTQTELSLVKTTTVIGDHHAFDPMEAL